MANISSIDWVNKRFFLHPDTVTNGFDAWEAVNEAKAIQQSNVGNGQNYELFIQRNGKIQKDLAGTKFTPRFVTLNAGWRGVPQNVDHELTLLVETLNVDDGQADRGCFDRSTLTAQVDIDAVYQQVEVQVVEVATSGLTPAESAQMEEIFQAHYGHRRWDKVLKKIYIWRDNAETDLVAEFDVNSDLTEYDIVP